jgi:predicted XRE-type DNA-binding protein
MTMRLSRTSFGSARAKPEHELGRGNVFADAGLPNAEDHLLKAKLVSRIEDLIEERHLSQTKAAKLMGLAQPDLSNILRGRFRGYSAERLMRCFSSLDGEIQIRQRGRTLATIPA